MKPFEIKELLEKYGRTAIHSLGQNFFTDQELLHNVVQKAGFDSPILEVGPGLGALTSELLSTGLPVIAVEKDPFLANLLPDLVPSSSMSVICNDILHVDVQSVMGPVFSVAGNLPYYITSQIVEKFLVLLPTTCMFMVQKEAAERFFARPGDRVYGPVAILSQLYFNVSKMLEVSRSSYYPQPNVDSAVVLLKKKTCSELPPPEQFLRFVSAALSKRRKTLANNFQNSSLVRNTLSSLNITTDIRAEALAPETLAELFGLLPDLI